MTAPIAQDRTEPPSSENDLLLCYLRDRDVECPLCRYNLRNLTVPRCPECGRELQLSIALSEPYLRAWLVLVISLSASAGVGIFCLLIVLKWGWPNFGYADHPGLAHLTFAIQIAIIPVAATALLLRRVFLQLSRPAQWRIAAPSAVSCIALVLYLVLGVG